MTGLVLRLLVEKAEELEQHHVFRGERHIVLHAPLPEAVGLLKTFQEADGAMDGGLKAFVTSGHDSLRSPLRQRFAAWRFGRTKASAEESQSDSAVDPLQNPRG